MSFKQEILSRVPAHLHQEAHVAALLEQVKRNNIKDGNHLSRFLRQEISLVERFLQQQKHRGPTAVKSVRDKAIQLNLLKKCQALAEEYIR